MIRRRNSPGAGKWAIPGGRVERGEALAQAVLRELKEETSIEGVCGELLGWAERMGEDYHFVVLDFLVTAIEAGEPRPGDDATEARWMGLADLTSFALVDGLEQFLRDHGILEPTDEKTTSRRTSDVQVGIPRPVSDPSTRADASQ